MVKALRRWLEANELLAIVTGVLGVLVVLFFAVTMVKGPGVLVRPM